MEISVSTRLVDVIYEHIGFLTNEGINSLEAKNPLANAIIQSSALSLISSLTSISGMIDNLFSSIAEIDADFLADFKTELFNEEPFLFSMVDYLGNLPKEITTKDLLNTMNSISKGSIQFHSIKPSKDDICIFLISVAEFYLLDKEIDFNRLFKSQDTIQKIKQYSWGFERINPNIKQLFLSKIKNNELFLDIDLIYSFSVNVPVYLNEILTSLNLRNLERGTEIYSESFGNDLRKIKSIQASKNAKIKADKEATKREPLYQKLEKLWDKDSWSSKGRGKYSQFAKYILYNDEIEGLEYDAIRNYISKYDKSKV